MPRGGREAYQNGKKGSGVPRGPPPPFPSSLFCARASLSSVCFCSRVRSFKALFFFFLVLALRRMQPCTAASLRPTSPRGQHEAAFSSPSPAVFSLSNFFPVCWRGGTPRGRGGGVSATMGRLCRCCCPASYTSLPLLSFWRPLPSPHFSRRSVRPPPWANRPIAT